MAVVFDKEDLCDYIFGSAWADNIQINAISHQNLSCFIDVLIQSITNHVFENKEFKYVLFHDLNDTPIIKRMDKVRYYDASEMTYLVDFEPTDEHEKVSNRYRAAFNSDVVPNALHESYLNIQDSLTDYFNMGSSEPTEHCISKTFRKTKS